MAGEHNIHETYLLARESHKDDDELQEHLKHRIAHPETIIQRPLLVYDRLNHPSNIRLLTLLPGNIGDKIQCELHEINTDVPLCEYIALSYAWGNHEIRLPIEIKKEDGTAVSVHVTINLYSSLLRLRDRESPKVFWIDAICIDQSGDVEALEERARQVQLMGIIFSVASKVIVDLGGASKSNLDILLDAFRKFDRAPMTDIQQGLASVELVPDVSDFTWTHKAWPHYKDLMARPWFVRVWVVQEFVLAKSISMMIGNKNIDLDYFTNTIDKMVKHQVTLARQYVGDARYVSQSLSFHEGEESRAMRLNSGAKASYRSFQHMVTLRRLVRQNGEKRSITELLETSRTLKATDSRDHIYGILGLLQDQEASEIAVNYTRTESELSATVGRVLVRNGWGDYCLARAGGISIECPSWVPTLLEPEGDSDQLATREFRAWYLRPNLFSAGGCGPAITSVADESHILAIQGMKADVIDSIAIPLPRKKAVTNLSVVPWYYKAKSWARSEFASWSTSRLQEVLSRTLIADIVDGYPTRRDPVRATSEALEDFDVFDRMVDAYFAGHGKSVYSDTQAAMYCGYVDVQMYSKKICRTRQNRLALIPDMSTHENEIWIFAGISTPYVLRRLVTHHVLVGPCYVHDLMDGEALTLPTWNLETVYLK